MDFVEETPKSSLSDTEDSEETLEDALRVFGDIAVEIQNGADVKLSHPPEFYYEAAEEIQSMREVINELELLLEGAKRGVERYIFGKLEIVSESGEIITVLDEWVSKDLIEGAIQTYVTKAITRGSYIVENNQ